MRDAYNSELYAIPVKSKTDRDIIPSPNDASVPLTQHPHLHFHPRSPRQDIPPLYTHGQGHTHGPHQQIGGTHHGQHGEAEESLVYNRGGGRGGSGSVGGEKRERVGMMLVPGDVYGTATAGPGVGGEGEREREREEQRNLIPDHDVSKSEELLYGFPESRSVSRAYQEHKRQRAALRTRILNILLVSGDCFFLGMQPILVYLCKTDGKFLFDPISVNFLTELCKMAFAIAIILFHRAQGPQRRRGDGTPTSLTPASAFTLHAIWKAAKANTLLAVPAGLYSVNNYLKFVMQLYFKPTTVKMLGNLKILVIALLLKVVMKREFSIMQWEALALLLIGISVNQIPCGPSTDSSLLSLTPAAFLYTFFSVTIPSTASVFNEYALKSQFDTSVHLQNFFMYCYGVLFNLIFLIAIHAFGGGNGLNIFKGQSRATALLIANNALQGILSSFFFKYADAILKKYSSTIATIFTALASASLFGHTLTINFVLGVSIVIISMHQFFSTSPQLKDSRSQSSSSRSYSLGPRLQNANSSIPRDASLLEIAAGANEEANHHTPKGTSSHGFLPK